MTNKKTHYLIMLKQDWLDCIHETLQLRTVMDEVRVVPKLELVRKAVLS